MKEKNKQELIDKYNNDTRFHGLVETIIRLSNKYPYTDTELETDFIEALTFIKNYYDDHHFEIELFKKNNTERVNHLKDIVNTIMIGCNYNYKISQILHLIAGIREHNFTKDEIYQVIDKLERGGV
jgi:hypothetical protein